VYESFYGLRERPFNLTPDPRYLHLTAGHREALGNLVYGVSSRAAITLLIGEAGTGKTTLVRTALSQASERTAHVVLSNPTMTREEFVRFLAAQFELSADAASSKGAWLVELERSLRERDARGEITALLVDEGQSLPDELLEEIRLLSNIETDTTKLLPIVLIGQPELADRLNRPSLRQLKQRIALRCELRPFDLAGTASYIAARLRVARGLPANVFTQQAVAAIHEAARGIPRTINVLCENALLSGFAAGVRPIDARTVQDVCRDFHFDAEVREPEDTPVVVPAVPSIAQAPVPERADDEAPSAHAVGERPQRDLFKTFSGEARRLSFFRLKH
jgi:general secretion pathway protein A